MIDREHDLPITKQANVLRISRGSVYYLPRSVSATDLEVMRRLDRLHLEFPFAGSRMLRGLLAAEGYKIGRRHVKTLMRRMGIEALYPAVRPLPERRCSFHLRLWSRFPRCHPRTLEVLRGHAQIFRTVPSPNTLVRWVYENAFAPIVRARPCPPLADRFVLEVALIDYGPVLLRIPFGSRLAADTLSSEVRRAVAAGPPWL
jgi:HTH-like domain